MSLDCDSYLFLSQVFSSGYPRGCVFNLTHPERSDKSMLQALEGKKTTFSLFKNNFHLSGRMNRNVVANIGSHKWLVMKLYIAGVWFPFNWWRSCSYKLLFSDSSKWRWISWKLFALFEMFIYLLTFIIKFVLLLIIFSFVNCFFTETLFPISKSLHQFLPRRELICLLIRTVSVINRRYSKQLICIFRISVCKWNISLNLKYLGNFLLFYSSLLLLHFHRLDSFLSWRKHKNKIS